MLHVHAEILQGIKNVEGEQSQVRVAVRRGEKKRKQDVGRKRGEEASEVGQSL